MIRERSVLRALAAGMVAATAAVAPTAEGATASGIERPTPRPAQTTSPSETVRLLIEKALPNVPGKTFTTAIVDFPPSARAAPHRHGNAFVYAYVLEGRVLSRLANEPVHTYHTGESWVEPPGAHHLLTENVSKSEPAKLLVVFVSDTGAPIKIPDPAATP
ncbi:cupin domain-containing protein [Streptomyces sp. NBC_01450]|uniref:cupin domain-containing protein n=1 Tax=Streptomyces sp. NBC_01450 TaxID=2903871 RepID=UPI002E3390E4|nr:cupin domain-containing protein [Streptomyces sp. NBC_01450]